MLRILLVSFFLMVAYFIFWSMQQENECLMTFMFDTPAYYTVNLPDNYMNICQTYGLVFYTEGLQDSSDILKLSMTTPVLFIPGNKGNFMELRSYASVALTMAYNRDTNFSFRYFSMDFNEDYSALSADIIERETECTSLAISELHKIYKINTGQSVPVIIIGHSLGGVIGHYLFTKDYFDPSLVNIVISLSSPLVSPVLAVSDAMHGVYSKLRVFWKSVSLKTEAFRHLLFISITGGVLDHQIYDGMGDISALLPPDQFLHLSTNSMKHVWLSVDHRCITWCNQLVLAINKFLFAVINQTAVQPNESVQDRIYLARSNFISQPITLDATPEEEREESTVSFRKPLIFQGSCQWQQKTKEPIVLFHTPEDILCTYLQLGPISTNSEERSLIFSRKLDINDFYLCETVTESLTCSELKHLPGAAVVSISLPGVIDLEAISSNVISNTLFVFNLHASRSISMGAYFLVVKHSKKNISDLLFERIANISSRIVSDVPFPLWFSSGSLIVLPGREGSNAWHPLEPVFFRLRLPTHRFLFGPAIPAPILAITTTNCSSKNDVAGLLTLVFPWDNQIYHTRILSTGRTSVSLQTISVPPNTNGDIMQTPYVDLILNPTCNAEITVHYSVSHWLFQLFRIHGLRCWSLIVGHLLFSIFCLVASQTLSVQVLNFCLIRKSRQNPLPRENCVTSHQRTSDVVWAIGHRQMDVFACLLRKIAVHVAIAFSVASVNLLIFLSPILDYVMLNSNGRQREIVDQLGLHGLKDRARLQDVFVSILPIYIIHFIVAVTVPLVISVLTDSWFGLPGLIHLLQTLFSRFNLFQSFRVSHDLMSVLIISLTGSIFVSDAVVFLLLTIYLIVKCSVITVERLPANEALSTCGLRRTPSLNESSKGGVATVILPTALDCHLILFLIVLCILSAETWTNYAYYINTLVHGSWCWPSLSASPCRLFLILFFLIYARRSHFHAPTLALLLPLVVSVTTVLSLLAGMGTIAASFEYCRFFSVISTISCLTLAFLHHPASTTTLPLIRIEFTPSLNSPLTVLSSKSLIKEWAKQF